MKDFLEKVYAFNKMYVGEAIDQHTPLTDKTAMQHISFCEEEMEELLVAVSTNDFTEQIDALIDQAYFNLGTLLRTGLPPAVILECFEEVHRSNMTKYDDSEGEAFMSMEAYYYRKDYQRGELEIKAYQGKWAVFRKEDGKILKSRKFQKPNLQAILDVHLVVNNHQKNTLKNQ